MAKVNGLIVLVAGTASLCTAYVMHSRTATHHQIKAKKIDFAMDSSSRTDTVRVVASEGMRAFLHRPTTPVEQGEDHATAVVTVVKRNSVPIVNTSAATARWATPTPG